MPDAKLRPVEASDSEKIFNWRNLPEVRAYMYTDHEIPRAEHDAWFPKAMADEKRKYWIIQLDGEDVGLVNLYDIDRKNGRCAWAYYLGSPSTRGKGLGSWVEYTMLEQVFTAEKLNKLWCEVLESNEAVWQLHEKFGFKREALFRDHVVKNGAWVNVVGLGLLAADWNANRIGARARVQAKGFTL